MASEFSAPKAKRFPIRPRSERLARAMQSCAFILAVNWCLQGVRGMDGRELAFRLGLELALVVLMARLGAPMVVALIVAHTLNFTLNGQVWVCARYCRSWRGDPAALEGWLRRTVGELQGLAWLREAVCIGSRGDRGVIGGDRSDIDLRLVFPPGSLAWLRVNLLLLRLRARAFLARVPLDLYAYDDPGSLRRFDQRERLLVLVARDRRLAAMFPTRVTPWPG
jgi:hypothetical protein